MNNATSVKNMIFASQWIASTRHITPLKIVKLDRFEQDENQCKQLSDYMMSWLKK